MITAAQILEAWMLIKLKQHLEDLKREDPLMGKLKK